MDSPRNDRRRAWAPTDEHPRRAPGGAPVRALGSLLALALAAALCGCGGSSGSSSSSASASAPTGTSAATTATGATDTAGATAPPSTSTTKTSTATTSTAAKPPAATAPKATTPAHTTPAKPKVAIPAIKIKAPKSSGRKPNVAPAGFGAITLLSSAFTTGEELPKQYTCDGAGQSPPLLWTGVPGRAQQLLLIAARYGSGAGTTIEWAVAMPAAAKAIPAGSLPAGAVVGRNGAGKNGWGGACGPHGQIAHITFLLYALPHELDLKTGFEPHQALTRAAGEKLATGFLNATYSRA